MKGLVWFREDLRLHDNTALYHAAKQCTDGIIGIYIIDTSFWKKHHMAVCRVQFLLSGLLVLSQNLQARGIPLLIKQVKKTAHIAQELYQCTKKYKLDALFFNKQYEVDEKHRDKTVCNYLNQYGIKCNAYDDQVILPPGLVQTKQGKTFSIFTPYKRAYLQLLLNNQNIISHYSIPKRRNRLEIRSNKVPLQLSGFSSTIIWPAGEDEAQRRLKKFIKNDLFDYYKTRDFPALSGTSLLSPYLSTGMISPRQCLLAALLTNRGEYDGGNKGATTWINELIWRDFYKHLLDAIPRLSKHQPYRVETDKLKWRYNAKQLLAWQQGNTGFPIVDAGMRQLKQLGWMHNRLRMIVAMFLTKNLFFDWRLGEDFFIRHLIDGDLAANNGGWQWSASTGTDAAPYFRIFNPIRQSERFDPQGDFIRQYCPELGAFDARTIHDPHHRAPMLALQSGYAKPIIDFKASRIATIKAFKAL
ncbi:MAG: deoxyribodipyrimidine photolyase [Bacteroidota bacterium]|jgi:deoxyribodipyrimidine photo-lyase